MNRRAPIRPSTVIGTRVRYIHRQSATESAVAAITGANPEAIMPTDAQMPTTVPCLEAGNRGSTRPSEAGTASAPQMP